MKAFATCLVCQAKIELKQRKDFESYTLVEVSNHFRNKHPEKLTDFGMPYTPIEFEGARG